MESRVDQAVKRFSEGYTCSQAVFATYADLFGIPLDQALKLASPFGGGMAGLRQVCGTVNGMVMLAGLYNGMTNPGNREEKKAHFATVKSLTEAFETENGSINCGQLKGLEPGLPEGFVGKPCVEYVKTCARLIEKHLLGE